jgi:hypothetical protein
MLRSAPDLVTQALHVDSQIRQHPRSGATGVSRNRQREMCGFDPPCLGLLRDDLRGPPPTAHRH